MGKTNFSGPTYGAKATLFSIGPVTPSTGATGVLGGTIVPAGEDWYATEVVLYRNSTGSTNIVVSVLDDSTSLGTVGVAGSSVAGGAVTIFTTDGGEYEGTRIASGSVITFTNSSHAGPNANLHINLRGFTRFVNSSRGE